MMLISIYKLPFLFLFFLVFSFQLEVYAKDHKNVKSTNSSQVRDELLAIRFPNSSTYEDAYIVRGRYNTFYVTLSDSVQGKDLAIEIVTPKNSVIKINDIESANVSTFLDDQEVTISNAVVNIENNITIEVFSESGDRNTYDVLVKKGIKLLDSMVYEFKEKYNIPGVSFAIANLEKTRTAYSSGYGYAIKESKTRVIPSHLFRLASMSKQHTAIAILKLIEEGRLGINDTVFGASGILNQFDKVPSKASRITIKHLLEHTSGYRTHPDYMFDRAYYGWSMERRIEAMLKSRQPNEPGTVFAYYNTGYSILGYIVEAITGKTFEQYVTELYASVGIDDIHVGGTQDERRPNEVAYYSQNSSNANGVDMEIRASAGGMIASTEQLIKLLWALDGNPSIPDLLTCETRDLMFTPSETGTSRYSLGWRTNHEYFPYSFYHGGTLAGVSTFWVYSHGYAVIFLCNSRSNLRQFDNELYKIARQMIEEASFLDL